MATFQILFWKDIPVQVRARDEKERYNLPLPPRFQSAIDQAAMEAGLTGDDAYTEIYHWTDATERPGSAQEVAESVASELIAQYAVIDWRKTAEDIKNG
jgi:Virulence factor